MRKRNITFLALLISGMISIVTAETIPLPEWAETTGSPTGSVQALEYINSVKNLLSSEAQDEINTLDSSEAKLVVVYRESIKSRLYKAEKSNDTYALMKALAEIQRLLELYEDQWEYLYKGDSSWSLDLTDSNSVGRVISKLQKLKEFQKRLDDSDDILNGLTNFNAVFDIPGGALTAYNELESAFFKGKQGRVTNLIEFLLNPKNKNGFTKGNTYFWKSKVYRVWYKDLTNSINYSLEAHKYPACLVYIAWSYVDAAKMFASLSKYDVAQGLLSIDVPNIDIKAIKDIRCLISANMYINKGKYTNAVVQLQSALLNECNYTSQVHLALNRIYNVQELWDNMKDKPLTHEKIYKTMSSAYRAATNTWCKELVQDALLHDWPLPSEVPATIMTNRLLSNNIFEYKKKTIKEE